MKIEDSQLKILLIGSNLLTLDQFNDAQKKIKERDVPIEDYLISQGIIGDFQLGQLIANFLGVPCVDLSRQKITDDVLNLVPEVVARSRGVVVFNKTAEELHAAMIDPKDVEMIRFLEKRSGLPVRIFYATRKGMNSVLLRYQAGVAEALSNILANLEKSGMTKTKKEQGIIDLVDTILQYAYLNGVSDVHFDPNEEDAMLRYRIDGILHDI
ncbi:MAG: hypothetical protein PHH21_02100, partial [Candidatus Pacebacteria bacterium]|nr:hypothetical protein [Candidatus Paceibacterota bacterium]